MDRFIWLYSMAYDVYILYRGVIIIIIIFSMQLYDAINKTTKTREIEMLRVRISYTLYRHTPHSIIIAVCIYIPMDTICATI